MSTPTIKIAVSQADATLVQTCTLTAGMQNLPIVKFSFSDEWAGLGKTAVCRAGSVCLEVLVTNSTITVPVECLETAGVNLIIGVYGTDTAVAIPTVWCSCGEILDGTDVDEPSNVGEATAELVDQMIAYAAEIEGVAETLEENVITEAQAIDTNANRYGTADVDVDLVDASETGKKLVLTFENLKGNGITDIAYSASGEYEGRINIKTDANPSGTNYDALIAPIAYFKSVTNRAQAYAIGTTGEDEEEEPVPADDPAYHNNSKYYAEQAASSATTASTSASSAMGYASSASSSKTAAQTAQGKAETAQAAAEAAATSASTDAGIASGSAEAAAGSAGEALTSAGAAESSATAAGNAQTAAETAQGIAETARDASGTQALKSEGYAVGKQNDVDVASGSTYYHNNAKYYSNQAGDYATAASGSASNASSDASAASGSASSASTNALKAEGYAVGKQNGVDVASGSPYYQNNAKYYADEAADSATAAAASAASSDGTYAQAMVADTYSTSKTYAVGDYCKKDGVLYRCKTAITTAESWTSGHWETAVLANDTKDLKNAINDIYIKTLLNGYDKNSLESTYGYWSNSNGAFVANSNYVACNKYAEVKPSTKYSLWYGTGSAGLYCYVCFYDVVKNFISGSNMASSNIITSPSNAKFVRIAVQKDKTNYVFCEGETYVGYNDFGYYIALKQDVNVTPENYETDKTLTHENHIADAKATGGMISGVLDAANIHVINAFDKNDVTTGGIWNLSDGVSLYPNQSMVAGNKYVLIEPGASYSVWYVPNGVPTASLYVSVCWYDGAKNFISGETKTDTNIFTAPNTARYMRVSLDSSRVATSIMTKGTAFTGYYPFGYSIGSGDALSIGDLSFFNENMIAEGVVTNGDVVASNENYFSLKRIVSAPASVVINVSAGWRLHLFYYVDGEQTSPTSGWWIYDTYTIPAFTPFSFYFQKSDGSSATFAEACAAVSLSGYTSVQYIHEEDAPVHYYTGEIIPLRKNKVTDTFKYTIVYESLPSGGLQACDLYNDVLCVCRGDDILMLYDYDDGSQIANTEAPVGHGNAFQFGHTKYNSSDEFPVAYASPFFDTDENNYSVVNKIRVTRTGGTLITKYKMPVAYAGYYGVGCVNDDDSIMYVVGFKIKDYVSGAGNALIVSAWDLKNTTANGDGSYTPDFIEKFELPFRMMMQGVKYINGRIIACHAPYDGNNVFHSTIFVIDVIKKAIVSEFQSLPITISGAEIEDSFFVPTEYGYNLGVLMANGRVHEMTL